MKSRETPLFFASNCPCDFFMNILVIGSGGREHALVWKLAQSAKVKKIFCAPGNAGTAQLATNVQLGVLQVQELKEFALRETIDLTVVGPDDSLAAGIADVFEEAGLAVFGPRKAAARLESSKSFAKDFCIRHGIPTAESKIFSSSQEAQLWCRGKSLPLVIKADGLALGKGVIIATTAEQAAMAIYRIMDQKVFGAAGDRIVIEEFLEGPECSVHAFVDGRSFLFCPDARDHKRVGEGDTGPNTGGMGTVSPSAVVDEEMRARIQREILEPFLRGLQADGLDFRGMLFPGLILTSTGPKVLEFNCRFGDPETQVLLRRLESDLVDLLAATASGRLGEVEAVWKKEAAACVILASEGYPGEVKKGRTIEGIPNAEGGDSSVVVFHAGTAMGENGLLSSGGRVLGVTALADDFPEARRRAYRALEKIHLQGAFYRRDIGGPPL